MAECIFAKYEFNGPVGFVDGVAERRIIADIKTGIHGICTSTPCISRSQSPIEVAGQLFEREAILVPKTVFML